MSKRIHFLITVVAILVIGSAAAGQAGSSGTPSKKPPAAAAKNRSATGPASMGPSKNAGSPRRVLRSGAVSPATLLVAKKRHIEELQAIISEFERQVREYRNDIELLVQEKYLERKRKIERKYEKQLRRIEAKGVKHREQSIVQFERFIRRYPNDPVYTPEALFRLAELYFERSNEAYLASMDRYYKDLDKKDSSANDSKGAMDEPVQSYVKSIDMYQKLINRFPGFRYIDTVYYLLGYCLSEQNERAEAKRIFEEMMKKYGSSEWAPEVWTRIGEYYFDTNRLNQATLAYENALTAVGVSENKRIIKTFYDKVLYKLGWTYYRNDQFLKAISLFTKLIEYADIEKKKGNLGPSDLRPEAIQYISVSFSDELWKTCGGTMDGQSCKETVACPLQLPCKNAGGVESASAYYSQKKKKFVQEILHRLGDTYFDMTQYETSVKAYRLTLQKFPYHPKNPEIQSRILDAFWRKREFGAATAAREKLVARYGSDTEWGRKNINDRKAIKKAKNLTELSLRESAIFHHKQANFYKLRLRLVDAKREYSLAAHAYAKYLDAFRASKDAYKLVLAYADCLFHSFDFKKAAKQYERVRDWKEEDRHMASAALDAILAYEENVKQLLKKGKLFIPPLPSADPGGKGIAGGNKSIPFSPQVVSLIKARDILIHKISKKIEIMLRQMKDKKYQEELKGILNEVPKVAYLNADIFYRHKNFTEARKRYAWVFKNYPDKKVSVNAGKMILASYGLEKNWVERERWSRRLRRASKTIAMGDKGWKEELKGIEVEAIFRKAESFDKAGKYDLAAKEYIRLVNKHKGSPDADKALYNAALAFEKVQKFGSALKAYKRLVEDYGRRSKLAHIALFRLAHNAYNSYNFIEAISYFLKLAQKYSRTSQAPDALYNAARTQERLGHYYDAAKNFIKYSKNYSDRSDAPDAYYRVATIYEKIPDRQKAISQYAKFIKLYKRKPRYQAHIVEATGRIAQNYMKMNERRKALKWYRATVREFDRRYLSDPDPIAAAIAAEAQFKLVEEEFREFEKFSIKSNKSKKQGKELKKAHNYVLLLAKKYGEIKRFKNAHWYLAAAYRMGYIWKLLANKVLKAPVPKEMNKPDLVDLYKNTLEDKAGVFEDKNAVPNYKAAVQLSHKYHVINEWTKKTLAALAKLRPSQYKVIKDEMIEMEMGEVSLEPIANKPIKRNLTKK